MAFPTPPIRLAPGSSTRQAWGRVKSDLLQLHGAPQEGGALRVEKTQRISALGSIGFG